MPDAPQHPARLVMIAGGDAELVPQLAGSTARTSIDLIKEETFIGRQKNGVDICLRSASDSISRRHCYIKYDRMTRAYYLVDMGSTNGTRLNNDRVEPNKLFLLHHGDFIDLGRQDEHATTFRFFAPDYAPQDSLDRTPIEPLAVTYDTDDFPAADPPSPEFEPEYEQIANLPLIYMIYSRYDRHIIHRLEETFAESSFLRYLELWTDRDGDVNNTAWQQKSERAIRAASAVILVMSPEASRSPNVARELTLAQRFERPIVSVLARGALHEAVPSTFPSGQWIDLRDGNYEIGSKQLLNLLSSYL